MISDREFRRTNGGRNNALLERDLMKQGIVIDDCVVEVNADQHGIGWSNGCARRNGGCIIRNPRQHPRGRKTQAEGGSGLRHQHEVACTAQPAFNAVCDVGGGKPELVSRVLG